MKNPPHSPPKMADFFYLSLIAMIPSSSSKLLLKNPLLSLLEKAQTTSQILRIHAQMITTDLISNTFAVSRLILASSVSIASNMDYAELVFSQIPQPNSFIYNTIIRGHAQSSSPQRALLFYSRMRRDGVAPDKHTYPFVLKACSLMGGLEKGMEIHGEILKRGFESDLFVRNGLISMYCRCGMTSLARKLFDGFPERDLVSWNSIIGGYVRCGEMGEAQNLFDEMPERDMFSWAIMIDGYGKKIGDIGRARELFNRMNERDLVCWNSMIDGYATVGDTITARELFEEMPERNVISWSIMIDGYARNGKSKEALKLFEQMLPQGIRPDRVSALGAVTACAQLGALDRGRWIHLYLEKNKTLLDVVVQTALVDMYMKCGSLDYARGIFESMPERNTISWNVMIVGLGINGCGKAALVLFSQMEREGIFMDDVTFLGVLIACTHAGLESDGLRIFERMGTSYGMEPKVEHYGCLVDLLGRAGRLDEAKNVIETMPMEPNPALWGSLLAACRIHRRVDLAEAAVEQLVELKADDSGMYVLMSNIYAEEKMWGDVLRIRKLMNDRGMKKESGGSVIEVDGIVWEFVNGDRSHLLSGEIYSVIWNLSKMLMSVR
ncbi:pentatricopeptide repeat-containing protein At1g08070, chloroplastic-like [Tasmannia lanceolata]|uniref:pentatricopeptide repeat-containing protein At1g08070, chloroplastic-like n=1 Tax=Tasmannia lanceolata TaxID=3420 RepID=UPI00406464DE